MESKTQPLQVLSTRTGKVVATIQLNGYSISSGGPLGLNGNMHSFCIQQGNLWSPWSHQEVLVLRDRNGRQTRVKIAALPVEDDSFGLIEFL
ncbi:MAG: hypothetical protein ACE5E7_15520 [Anaerolineae bacterium]